MNKLFGIGLALLTSAFIMMLAGGIYQYIDIPRILIIGGFTVASLSIAFGMRMFGLLLAPFKMSDTVDREQYLEVIRCYHLMDRSVFSAAVAATLFSVIAILSNMSDPKSLGPSLAVALLSILYAVIFVLVISMPIKTSFIHRYHWKIEDEEQAPMRHDKGVVNSMIALAGFVFVLTFASVGVVFIWMA